MLVYYISEFITKEDKAEGSFLQNTNRLYRNTYMEMRGVDKFEEGC